MLLEITYKKNDIFHVNLIETQKSIPEIKDWYKVNRPKNIITDIREATPNSIRPSKPVIYI